MTNEERMLQLLAQSNKARNVAYRQMPGSRSYLSDYEAGWRDAIDWTVRFLKEGGPMNEAMKSIEDIAKTAHEMNRLYCQAIGDNSQPEWDDAPEWQRESAQLGVKNILNGTVKQPSDSHVSWLQHKQAEGWVYGEVKDPDAKTHPCMVPYEELSETQRAKDSIFFAVVKGMLASRPGEET